MVSLTEFQTKIFGVPQRIYCTYHFWSITSEHVTLEDGGLHFIAMTTRECKAATFLWVRRAAGTEQNVMDTIRCNIWGSCRVNYSVIKETLLLNTTKTKNTLKSGPWLNEHSEFLTWVGEGFNLGGKMTGRIIFSNPIPLIKSDQN